VKLLLGWTWDAAVDYADERGWAIRFAGRSCLTADGEDVVWTDGQSLNSFARLEGLEFSEIIRGPLPVHPDVSAMAKAMLRRAPRLDRVA